MVDQNKLFYLGLLLIVLLFVLNQKPFIFSVFSPPLNDFSKCMQSEGIRKLVDGVARCECRFDTYYNLQSGMCEQQSVITITNPLPTVIRETCLKNGGIWFIDQYIDFDKKDAKIVKEHCECASGYKWNFEESKCVVSPADTKKQETGNVFDSFKSLFKDNTTDIIVQPIVNIAFFVGLLGVVISIILVLAR